MPPYKGKRKSTVKRRRIARPKKGSAKLIRALAPSQWGYYIHNRPYGSIQPQFKDNILNYTESYEMNTGVSAGLTWSYCVNSIEDPDATYVGHQPMGKDILAQLYTKYAVWKVTFKLTVTSYNGNTCPGVFTIRETGDQNSPSGNSGLEGERPRSKELVLGNNQTKTLYYTVYPYRTLGMNMTEWLDDDMEGDYNSTSKPNNKAYVKLHLGTVDQSQKFLVRSDMKFYVRSFMPVQMSQN